MLTPPASLPATLSDLRPMPGVPGIWTSDQRGDGERELTLLEREWHPAEKRCFARYRDRFCQVEAYGADPQSCLAALREEYAAARERSRAQLRLFAAVERMQVAS